MNRQRIAVFVLVLVPFAWLFGTTLATPRSFAFRDAAHFYYPLFKWTTNEWAEGRVPLWNPDENCGKPVLADTTSSVLYPGMLCFALPGLDFTTRYKLYVTLHVLLAALAAFCLARRYGCSVCASGAGAVSYAFCGNVVFQYCNVVFLVGAAWLPFAVLAADRMLCQRSWKWALGLGAILALMVLGGDPQAAYHAGLLATFLAIFLWRRDVRLNGTGEPRGASRGFFRTDESAMRRTTKNRFTLLSIAAVAGGILAAVQILPAVEWSRQSTRANFQEPRNIYEAGRVLLGKSGEKPKSERVAAGLFGEPKLGSHQDKIYQFSVGPWRFVEMIWPNVTGKMFPENRRWLNAYREEGRIWTPSLYMGLLPLLVAIGGFRFQRGPVRQRWLTWCVVLSLLASMGVFGMGWLSQLVAQQQTSKVAPQVGGVYWLMVTFLPAYANFRYPAKVMVIAALGLSMLAAKRWDHAFRRSATPLAESHRTAKKTQESKLFYGLIAVGVVSFLGAIWFFAKQPLVGFEDRVWPDYLFGPLDSHGASVDVMMAYLHAFVVVAAAVWMWRRLPARTLPYAMLKLTAVELAVAQSWLVPSASSEIWEQKSEMAEQIRALEDSKNYRVYRGSDSRWYQPQWREKGSRERLAEWLDWEHDTMFPRFNLQSDLAMVGSYSSLDSADYTAFMNVAKRHGIERRDCVWEPNPVALAALSTKYLILPTGFAYPGAKQMDGPDLSNAKLWRNENHLPRAWIVHEFTQLPPLENRQIATIEHRTQDVLFPAGRPRDLRTTAVVESNESLPMLKKLEHDDVCRIVAAEPNRVVVECDLASDGLMVLNDSYFPGWTAELQRGDQSRHVEIFRTNRIMRGVFVPAGKSRVVFRYRPSSFRIGAIVSGLAWLLLLMGTTIGWVRTRTGAKATTASPA